MDLSRAWFGGAGAADFNGELLAFRPCPYKRLVKLV